MVKKIRFAFHKILYLEISFLLFILYFTVLSPLSLFSRFQKHKHNKKTAWTGFQEKYGKSEDLRREG